MQQYKNLAGVALTKVEELWEKNGIEKDGTREMSKRWTEGDSMFSESTEDRSIHFLLHVLCTYLRHPFPFLRVLPID